MIRDYLGNIPVQLIQHCQKEHLETYFRTYLALKYASKCGNMLIDKESRSEWAEALEISTKTLDRHLEKLKELKWISIDRNDILFIRGYGRLQHHVEQRFRKRVELHTSNLDRKKFRAYLLGAVISYQVHLKMLEQILAGPKKWGSLHAGKTPHPLSQRYIAKITNLCKDEIVRLIQIGVDQGFIKKKRKYLKTNFALADLPLLREEHESGTPYPVKRKGKVFLRDSDHFYKVFSLRRYRPSGQNKT